MQSPTKTTRTPKLISPDTFSGLVQPEGRPISGGKYTCPTTAILGKAATETSADATEIINFYKYIIARMRFLAADAPRPTVFQKPTIAIWNVMDDVDGLVRQFQLQYLHEGQFKWGRYAAELLSKVEDLNSENPGSLHLGNHLVAVTAEERDEFYQFVREIAQNAVACVEERVPDEPLLRALVTMFDASQLKAALSEGSSPIGVIGAYGNDEVALVGQHFDQDRGDSGDVLAHLHRIPHLPGRSLPPPPRLAVAAPPGPLPRAPRRERGDGLRSEAGDAARERPGPLVVAAAARRRRRRRRRRLARPERGSAPTRAPRRPPRPPRPRARGRRGQSRRRASARRTRGAS